MRPINRDTGLTEKQERFCRKYVECVNASDAYRFAYDCSRMKPETVNRAAAALMRNSNIATRIDHLKSNLAEALNVSAARVLREHCRIAFSDATRIRSGWMNLKEFESLTEDERACIQSVETRERKTPTAYGECLTETYVKIKLYDKQKALDSISQMLGYNAPQKIDGDIKIKGLNVEVADLATAERLKELTE